MKHFNYKILFFIFIIFIFATVVRSFFLADIPPSLYSDEINQGYNAYSILLSGKDEHGIFLPISFRSFGDWKPPLPTYLMIPSIFLFGLNEFAVRLPSVILGIGSIFITFFLTKELFSSNRLALLSSFFLSISPWHILQSRSAMLVIVALFFFELGIYFFIKGVKNNKLFILSFIFFAFSIYSYYGMRVITPLMILFLIIFYRKDAIYIRKWFIFASFFSLLILTPLLLAFLKEPDVILGRARTVSIFYDQGVKLRQWELITQDGLNTSPLISRFFHNNVYMYVRNFLQRLLSHFDWNYLFFIGDKSPPFQIPEMGILYLADSIFLLVGLINLLQNKNREKFIIIFWIIFSLVPAALTFMTPSSNRTFNEVVPLVIFIAFGVTRINRLKYTQIISLSICFIYIFSFGYFLNQYFYNLKINHADYWNYGWKEVVNYVNSVAYKYDQIEVADVGMPYIYFLFYNQYDPIKYQNEAIRTYVSDQFGYEHVEGFDKYFFQINFNWKYAKENMRSKTLYIIPNLEAENDNNFIKIINYPNGKIAYKIFSNE